MDITALQNIGLTDSEIKIYIQLLEEGSCGAGILLEKTGLHNSVTHLALNALIEKGLVSYIIEHNRRKYQATDPETFLEYIEDKKTRVKQIIPELKAKQDLNHHKESATLYKGKQGITKVYNKLVQTQATEYLTFGGGEACLQLMGETWWSNIHTKRLDNKLKARQVWDHTVEAFGKKDFMKTELTHIRIVPEEFANFQETAIVGKFVAITLFTENPYSILIEDQKVADGYKKYFEILWNTGKDLLVK